MLHSRTLDRIREECKQPMQQMFHGNDFIDKKIVFIVAKTYGAASVFLRKTPLKEYRGTSILYLSNEEQLYSVKPQETIVVKLSQAEEIEQNVDILNACNALGIKIVKYKNISPESKEG